MHARKRHQRVTHTPRVVYRTAISSTLGIKNRMQILDSIKAEGGFVTENIEIREGPFGSSVFSTEKIDKDVTIMEINKRSIISVNSILDSGKHFRFTKNLFSICRHAQKFHGIAKNQPHTLRSSRNLSQSLMDHGRKCGIHVISSKNLRLASYLAGVGHFRATT